MQSPDDPSLAIEAKLRRVRYERHEFHGDSEAREDSLLVLVYDAAQFAACGVLPPLHLFNQLLLAGGSDGGMSPGATWEPFSISEDEYRVLIEALRTVPPEKLRPRARFADLPFTVDPSFDHHTDYIAWMFDVCAKHRAGWHAAQERGGLTD